MTEKATRTNPSALELLVTTLLETVQQLNPETRFYLSGLISVKLREKAISSSAEPEVDPAFLADLNRIIPDAIKPKALRDLAK